MELLETVEIGSATEVLLGVSVPFFYGGGLFRFCSGPREVVGVGFEGSRLRAEWPPRKEGV